ncbi:MAG: hypothetical protein Q8P23_00450 [bacterium]|nr:hypothetical protein [bacterium]
MFEKFFSGERKKSPEAAERIIKKVVERELSFGVNGPAIYMAFTAARKENQDKKLGMANNYLLNIVKDTAFAMSDAIEDSLYGGPDQTFANIEAEITRIRNGLSDQEKRS